VEGVSGGAEQLPSWQPERKGGKEGENMCYLASSSFTFRVGLPHLVNAL
jgi:hypothetical protein